MMKNNFPPILLLTFCVIVSWNCAKKDIRNIDSKGKSIICFGDSITFGYGAEKGEDYPSNLAKITGLDIINSGVDADTTVEALKRLKSDVLDRDPYLVIIEFCGNDFLRKIPIQETVNNISSMIDQIQAEGAIVVLVDISAGLFLKEYRSAFKKLADNKGAVFIPSILSSIITNPSMKSDFLHPNASGYAVIAERIHKKIAPYLIKKERLAR